MNEKEVAKQFDERVSQLVESWGFVDQGFGTLRSKVVSWLTNFQDDEMEDAYLILNKIDVISPGAINTALGRIANKLRGTLPAGPLVVASLEGEGGSSGSQFLYSLAKELQIPKGQVLAGDIESIVAENKTVVLVDDLVGTGGEAISAWDKIKNCNADVYYCPLFCFEEGKRNIEVANCFDKFFPQNILGEEFRAFGEHSKYFTIPQDRERLKALAKKYGDKILPKHPLGYKNGQAMIAWSTTMQAPNNSLPIIWGGPRNEAVIPWNPVFERIVSPSSKEKNKEQE